MGCPCIDRLRIRWHQQGWVATDEMAFYLQKLNAWALPSSQPLVVSGRTDFSSCLSEWMMEVLEEASLANTKKTKRTAILVNQHWTPVMLQASENELRIHTAAVGEAMLSTLPAVAAFDDITWHTDTVRSHSPSIAAFKHLRGCKDTKLGTLPCPYPLSKPLSCAKSLNGTVCTKIHKHRFQWEGF